MTIEEYNALQEALDGTLFIPHFNDFISHVNTAFRIHTSVKDYKDLGYEPEDIAKEAHEEKMLLDLLCTLKDIMEKHEGHITVTQYQEKGGYS